MTITETPGTNRPPLITTADLEDQFGPLMEGVDNLAGKLTTLPATIEDGDETTYGTWIDVVAEMNTFSQRIEAQRKEFKAPYLAANSTIEGFFKGLEKKNNDNAARIASICQDFLRRKRDAERARLEAEARRQREEEERKRREAEEARRKAETAKRDETREKHQRAADAAAAAAQQAAIEAADAAAAANARSADLARTRSHSGTLGTLQDVWKFRVDDIDKVKGAPLWQFVTRAAKEAAIRSYIAANAPKNLPPNEEWQPLAGVTVYRDSSLQTRR